MTQAARQTEQMCGFMAVVQQQQRQERSVHMAAEAAAAAAAACKPWCLVVIVSPSRASPSAGDHGHGCANYPRQKLVWQRPEPVQEVKAVKAQQDGRVSAGESAPALPAALRYGKRQGARPIFTRTLGHSHTQHRPHERALGTDTPLLQVRVAMRRATAVVWAENAQNLKNFSGEALVQHCS
ncbi:hypothetical protein WMY93_005700 [Mugilogobius chulae]|uniref:Uncharacterized protein n=1 Tax=Mugilogobius chulae TaxID=88201 RepID=A0AAW0PIL0_9GOBI